MSIEIPDELLALFHARIERRDDAYVVEIPASEVRTGPLSPGDTCRVGLAAASDARSSTGTGTDRVSGPASRPSAAAGSTPPVETGDELKVVIEDQGDEGDGIARVGPGFVVFVSDTDPGDRVRIEITDVTASYAFGDVVETLGTGESPSDSV